MNSAVGIAQLYESWVRPNSANPRPGVFVHNLRKMLGLSEDGEGRPTLLEQVKDPASGDVMPRIRPGSVSLRALYEGIHGWGSIERVNPAAGGGAGYPLLEGPAIEPSAFAHINAWTGATQALLSAKILEGYQSPEFVGNSLVEIIPSRLAEERFPGVSRMAEATGEMLPGQAHDRTSFGERYVDSTRYVKRGRAVEVTREAVFFDRSNLVMAQARSLGETLGLNREKRILRAIMGVVNPYKYNGTTYNTYLTSGNWINTGANNLIDWKDINEVLSAFSRMRDQETSEAIAVMPNTILVTPGKELLAQRIVNSSEVRGTTLDNAGLPRTQEMHVGANPIQGRYRVVSSVIANQIATDTNTSTGLNITQAAADELWFMLNDRRFAYYRELWPMTISEASPGDYMMKDRDLVLAVFANEAGEAGIMDPRFGYKNTAE